MKDTLLSIWNLYADGFRNMTWGRPLWILIFLKVIVLFWCCGCFSLSLYLREKVRKKKANMWGRS